MWRETVQSSDVNKAISIKAKTLIPKSQDYQFVLRPGQGRVFARARQTTPSVTWHFNYKS